MVYLAITSQGLQHALRAVEKCAAPIWCGSDAISESDFENLERSTLMRFSYALGGESQEVLTGAVGTIQEHHPGESVWIEHV